MENRRVWHKPTEKFKQQGAQALKGVEANDPML
jgi:hypothetical protein